MQPSLPTNSSIEELRLQNQVLEQLVGKQRGGKGVRAIRRNLLGRPKLEDKR